MISKLYIEHFDADTLKPVNLAAGCSISVTKERKLGNGKEKNQLSTLDGETELFTDFM